MTQQRKVVVWDLPTRLFHWALVILVVVSFVSVKIGGNAMDLHSWSGYAILALVAFRIVWGFAGGRYSRFSDFVVGPGRVIAYLKTIFSREGGRHLGHNPLGAWSVVLMLLALAVQAVTGLFANDEIATLGPLASKVSESTSLALTRIHRVNEWVLIALVAAHVAAILYYWIWKRENLVGPMITGVKQWAGEAADSGGRSALAVVILAIAAGLVWWVVKSGN